MRMILIGRNLFMKGPMQIGRVSDKQKEGEKFVQFCIRMVFQPVPKLTTLDFLFKIVTIMLKLLTWLHSYDIIPK